MLLAKKAALQSNDVVYYKRDLFDENVIINSTLNKVKDRLIYREE